MVLCQLLIVWGIAMPAGFVFHKADAFAFCGVADNRRRPVVNFPSQHQRIIDLADAVAVDLNHMPAKIPPAVR